MLAPGDVTKFWIDEVGPKGWYLAVDDLDQSIRDRFSEGWSMAREGRLRDWKLAPDSMLAYLILLDQFPRNMFRGQAQAFATDKKAKAAAKKAIEAGWDKLVPEPERQFFYLPLMHSECLADQDQCIRLMASRMPESGAGNLLHAKAHREMIRRFGRFPYRNAALGQGTQPPRHPSSRMAAIVRRSRPCRPDGAGLATDHGSSLLHTGCCIDVPAKIV